MDGKLSAEAAKELIVEAEEKLLMDKNEESRYLLALALQEQENVAIYGGEHLKAHRHLLTEVIARAHLLAWLLDDVELAGKLYARLVLWTDKSNVFEVRRLEHIARVWHKRNQNSLLRMFPRLKRLAAVVRKFFRNVGEYEAQKHRLLP